MIIDLLWTIGDVFSVAALLCGAYLAFRETAPFPDWFGSSSADSASVLHRDGRLIDDAGEYRPDVGTLR